MPGIFSKIGSLISGIRERISGISYPDFDTNLEPQQTINEDGEIEDNLQDVEVPIIEEPRGSNLRKIFPLHSGIDILSRFKKPIDIIKQVIPIKKVTTSTPESPEASDLEIVFKEINFSEWMRERSLISVYRGIVPEGNPKEDDEMLLLESVREKIKTVLRKEQTKKKRLRFSILLMATISKTDVVKKYDDNGKYTHSEVKKTDDDFPFKSEIEYILKESDINDDIIDQAYNQIFNKIYEMVVVKPSGVKYKRGVYIDVQVGKYEIVRGGSYLNTPKKVANT